MLQELLGAEAAFVPFGGCFTSLSLPIHVLVGIVRYFIPTTKINERN